MKTIIAAAILLVSLSASAQVRPHQTFFESGNDLLAKIKSRPNDETGYGNALHYIRGVADGTSGITHCTPNEVTNGQMLDMAADLIEVNPSLRHRSAAAFVGHALSVAFPCPKAVKPATKTF